MNKNFYYNVEVNIESEIIWNQYFDKIEEFSQFYSCDGIEEFDLNEVIVDDILGERSFSGGDVKEELLDEVDEFVEVNSYPRTIKFYFYENDYQANANLFHEELIKLGLESKLIKSEVENWSENWKENFKSITISENLEVLPIWLKDQDQINSKKKLYINPAMAFGTGGHETTYLCLVNINKWVNELLSKNLIKDNQIKKLKILDFGTGSGILSIATYLLISNLKEYKLIIEKIDMVDIEIESLKNAKENINLNFENINLNDKIFHLTLDKESLNFENHYNLIVANILLNVLIKESSFLSSKLLSGGDLILSGILVPQVPEIIEEFEKYQLSHYLTEMKGDWSLVWFKKR
jgi:ribosomal protein L11 methyltransferase